MQRCVCVWKTCEVHFPEGLRPHYVHAQLKPLGSSTSPYRSGQIDHPRREPLGACPCQQKPNRLSRISAPAPRHTTPHGTKNTGKRTPFLLQQPTIAAYYSSLPYQLNIATFYSRTTQKSHILVQATTDTGYPYDMLGRRYQVRRAGCYRFLV